SAVSVLDRMSWMPSMFLSSRGLHTSWPRNWSSDVCSSDLRLPEFLQLILPLSLYIGILLVLGGMYVTNEITVMSACGIGRKAIKIGRASCRAGAPEAVTGPRAVKQPGRPRAAPSVPSSDIA